MPSNLKVCNSEPSQSITIAFICHKATGMHFLLWTYFNCQVLHLVLSGSSILKGQIDSFRSSVFYTQSHTCCRDICPYSINQPIDPDLSMRAMRMCVCVMVKEAGSDLHSSMELPGLGLIVHCSSTHLYNWSKLMPAAVQSVEFLEVSSWSGEMMLGKAVGYLAATGVMWVFTELFHLRRSCVKFD